MTVSTTDNRVSYAGDGVTTVFYFPNRFLADADLVVLDVLDSTGAETIKTLTTHYTVSGAGAENGGSVTMLTAPAAGHTLVIYRDPTLTQPIDLVNGDPLNVETGIERGLDRLTTQVQRVRDLIDRTMGIPDGDTGLTAADMKLPAKVTRASKYLAFDAAGKPLASAAQSGVPTSTFMATVLDDVDGLAAVNTLIASATAPSVRAALGLVIGTDVQADLDVPSQAESEAGTATTERVWTAQRIGQAIAVLAQNAVNQLGQCRLVRDSATQLKLNPHNGNLVFINGVGEQVPSAGVTVTNGGLSANTNYYVYVYMATGVMTLEFSATVPVADTTYGHRIKTGDATRSYVGNVRTDGSSQFPAATVGVATNVRSWFNPIYYFRADYHLFNHAVGSALATPSGVAWPFNALTASTMPEVPFLAMAKIEKAQIRWVYSSNNVGDALYLVDFDNGPTNINTIVTRNSLGGGAPVNEVDDVTTAIRNLQKNLVTNKNLGYRYSAAAASTFVVYRASLEILWALEDARE